MTRAEHLAWAKERALEYVDAGDLTNASASFLSDLGKHDELRGHPVSRLIFDHQMAGLITEKIARDLIEGTR